MDKQDLKVGAKVTPIANDERVPAECRGRVFTVDKLNPKKAKCSADDGGRGINFPYELLTEATDENVEAGKGPITRPFEPREFFDPGEVVTLATAWKDWDTEKPLVVIKDGGGKRVNVAPIGGSDGQCLRVPPTGLVRRDIEWLAGALLERA